MEPLTAAEKQLAAEYGQLVKNCRSKFAEPGFDLPTLPGSAQRVLALIQYPKTTSRQIAQTLQQDPVLTAKFLRVANSAVYAGTQRIDSLHHAVCRLGFGTVRSVLLAVSLSTTIVRQKQLGESGVELWRHSIGTAVAAQALAPHLSVSPLVAFSAGLMHDIGKLPAWLTLRQCAYAAGAVNPAVVNTLVEDAHTEMGAALLEVWGMLLEVRLPAVGHHTVNTLSEAVAYVRNNVPGNTDTDSLARLLCCTAIADRALAGLGLAVEPQVLTLEETGLASELGLSKNALREYLFLLTTLTAQNDFNNL